MNFNTGVPTMKWEFGLWGETVDNWYRDGLPKHHYPELPDPDDSRRTPTSHLYSTAWTSLGTMPKGIAIMAGGLYWPTQGFPLDVDVKAYFKMDYTQRLVNVNLLFDPIFEEKILDETEDYFDYIDMDGVQRRFLKESGTIPTGMVYPIKDWKSWEQLKDERIHLDDLSGRFPPNWDELVAEYQQRDYPLALGGYPHGFFGTLAHLMGYETLFLTYYDDPKLVHDIVETFTDLWIAVYAEVLKYTDIDHVQIWEDISAGTGSMVAPKLIKEFMVPYYKKFTDFLKGEGVNVIFTDTDGDCFDILPLFLEGGITGMYPFEVSCGMDIVKVRKHFPDLQMMGGIPKSEIARGKKRIDEILEPVEAVLKTGGYIPFGDHFIPPDVSWENFKYYRMRLNEIIDNIAKSR
jgi:uroporphyrinogen decarboxylase